VIIGGKGQCTHVRACESVRGLVEEKHRKRFRGKQQCHALCSQSKVTRAVKPLISAGSLRRLVYYQACNCAQNKTLSALLRLAFCCTSAKTKQFTSQGS